MTTTPNQISFVVAEEAEEEVVVLTQIDRDIQRLKEETGLGDIGIMRLDWVNLMRQGVLVKLHMGRWRAQLRLSLEDLGIKPQSQEEERALRETLVLGNKLLAPEDWIRRCQALERQARGAVDQASFRVSLAAGKDYGGNDDDRFVVAPEYHELKKVLDRIQAEYMGLADYFEAHYDRILEELAIKYSSLGETSFRNLIANGHKVEDKDTYVKEIVARALSAIPSPEEIKESFYFDVEAFYAPLPSLLAEEQAQAEAIELASQQQRDEAAAASRIRLAEVQAAETAAATKRRMQEEMHRDVIERAQKQKNRVVDQFLRDIQAQVSDKIYGVATDVLASIERNSYLHPRSIVQIKALVEKIEKMNFYGDADVDAMMDRLRELLGDSEAPGRDISEVLTDIATVSRASLLCLGQQTRTADKKASLVDEPFDAASVNSALRRLRPDDLEEVTEELVPQRRVMQEF